MYFQHHCHLALHWEYGPATIIRFGNKISTTYYFTTQSQLLATLSKKHYENIEGKREKAGNQHFLFFPTVFSTLSRGFSPFPAGPNFSPIPNPNKYTFFPIQLFFFPTAHYKKEKWPRTSYSTVLSQYSK